MLFCWESWLAHLWFSAYHPTPLTRAPCPRPHSKRPMEPSACKKNKQAHTSAARHLKSSAAPLTPSAGPRPIIQCCTPNTICKHHLLDPALSSSAAPPTPSAGPLSSRSFVKLLLSAPWGIYSNVTLPYLSSSAAPPPALEEDHMD